MNVTEWNKLTATERRIDMMKRAVACESQYVAELRTHLEKAEAQLIDDSLTLHKMEADQG